MNGKIKLLIGGSPCTHWSIAQTKNRETEPSGIGWELFRNYVVALKKYQPDYFLYENNKSMAPAIRAQITRELGVEPVPINSALVSAQNRQRLYWVGKRNPDGTYSRVDVEQPEDRGIILRDILESGLPMREKGYTLKANYAKAAAVNDVAGSHFPAPMKAEPVNITAEGKSKCLRATCYKDGIRNMAGNNVDLKTCVAEAVRIGTIESAAKNADFDSQQYRVYSPDGKSVTLCGQGGGVGARTGLYAIPMGRNTETAGGIKPDCIKFRTAPPLRVREATKQGYAEIMPGECVDLTMPGSKTRRGRAMKYKSNCLTTSCEYYEYCGTLDAPVYQVQDGYITIGEKKFPIKLRDGCYIIRKLTVTECKRLQTVPDGYIFPTSDTQAYKMLGNGWTVDVIAHIMGHFEGIREKAVEVLSMYDGMSCGRIALDKLGAEVSRYYATEIDKYAIQATMANYPDTVQLGDAFQVLADDWTDKVPGRKEGKKAGRS